MKERRETLTQLDSHPIEQLTEREQLIKKGRLLHDQVVSDCLAALFARLAAGDRKASGFSMKTGGRSVTSGTC